MNIYVGNLSCNVSEENLRQAFEAFGQVTSTIISEIIFRHKNIGQSRGFGFVEMPDQPGAQAAIENLDGKDLRGQQMSVNEEARLRTDRGRSDGRGGHRGWPGYGGRSL